MHGFDNYILSLEGVNIADKVPFNLSPATDETEFNILKWCYLLSLAGERKNGTVSAIMACLSVYI